MIPNRKLEAPHRPLESTPPRVVEKAAVVGYRLASAVLAFVPPALSRGVIGGASQLTYLLWPTKRRYSSANFGHVLGLPPTHPRVHRMALRAYREYARYVVELMRLPSRPIHEITNGIDDDDIEKLAVTWRGSGRPMIILAGHIGNNEAVAAALAGAGYPSNAVVDDSAYPELFALLNRQREAWGIHPIPWRNLRELFKPLRRNEILALVVDWGYRDDGIPVLLFGSWTTLPAGPAVLAAKTRAQIAFFAIRRLRDGRFRIDCDGAFEVPSSGPADLQRATQRMAGLLEAAVRVAPQQWYSFKPMWPDNPAEALDLEARAAAMLAGNPDPGPANARAGAPGS